ncbi:hypothetical protein ACFWBN_39510 [Streptomyces sp. NPDC059989]|uniref:hypothetical protein n=1 Tax=Streptomyces sp. NPDC059989 TaxID=3347026 RepID=UPI00368E9526
MKTSTSRTTSTGPRRLMAVAPLCHLCSDEDQVDQVLADPALTVTFHPASGIARQVALCEPCHSSRPSRGKTDLGPADLAGRVVERYATTLLADYEEHWSDCRADDAGHCAYGTAPDA